MTSSTLKTNENTIIGNVALYGATAGTLFAAGQAGDRFCVRNSGATAVVEGCGSNGCEYMTGGVAVILGEVGDNFAAGMTGGLAFAYDPEGSFRRRLNEESITVQRVETEHYEQLLHDLIVRHVRETQSRYAEQLLLDWQMEKDKFWLIVPKDMLDKLDYPLTEEEAAAAAKQPAE